MIKTTDLYNTNIKELAESFGVMFKGKKAICPFHDDNKASLHLNNNNTLKCFGCGLYLTPIEFIKQIGGIDQEKMREIEKLERFKGEHSIEKQEDTTYKAYDVMIDLINTLQTTGDNQKAKEYLWGRGINPYVTGQMKICYLSGNKSLGFLFDRYENKVLHDLGITNFYHNKDLSGDDYILIPYLQGIIVKAIKIRNIKEGDERKYLAFGQIGQEVYNSQALFSNRDELYITEGEIKALSLISNGYEAIAFSGKGTMIADKLPDTIKDKRIIINTDADGKETAYRLKFDLLKRGFAQVGTLLLDEDVDEYLIKEKDLTKRIRL